MKNPYEVLGIENFSDDQTVRDAYKKITDSIYSRSKLKDTDYKRLDEVDKALEVLSSYYHKEEVDQRLRENMQFDHSIKPIQSESIEKEQYIEKEYSREKTIDVEPKKEKMSFLKLLFIVMAVFLTFSFFYNFLFGKAEKKAKPQVPDEIAQAPKVPIENPLLSENIDSIENMVRYPNPSVFKSDIIRSPDGVILPQSASIIPTMPIRGDGMNTVIIKNPREEALFGRIICVQSEVTAPKVLRYFYIPPKGTLYLFQIPSGKQQIQVMTLTSPKAYVSPIYGIAIGSEVTLTKVADWDYPISPEKLF